MRAAFLAFVSEVLQAMQFLKDEMNPKRVKVHIPYSNL